MNIGHGFRSATTSTVSGIIVTAGASCGVCSGSSHARLALLRGLRKYHGIHRGRQQAHAGHVVDGILVRQLLGQRLTGLFGGQLVIRYEHGSGDGRIDRIVDGMESAVQRLTTRNGH